MIPICRKWTGFFLNGSHKVNTSLVTYWYSRPERHPSSKWKYCFLGLHSEWFTRAYISQIIRYLQNFIELVVIVSQFASLHETLVGRCLLVELWKFTHQYYRYWKCGYTQQTGKVKLIGEKISVKIEKRMTSFICKAISCIKPDQVDNEM